MSNFTASNGVTITLDFEGDYVFGGVSAGYTVKPDGAHEQALREFFQAEADERLGRWRWPEDHDYVVYLDNGDALVVNEADPRRSPDRVARRYLEDPLGSLGWGEFAARAYFDAHPEPKPWHAALPGEVWVVTFSGHSDVVASVVATDHGNGIAFLPLGHRYFHDVDAFAPAALSAARRIWPESKQ